LLVLFVTLAFALTACGDGWVGAYNPAIDTFNNAMNVVNTQLEAVSNDNGLIADPTWKSETASALTTLKNAAAGLQNLPAPQDTTLKQVDGLVKQVAAESIAAADGYQTAIDSGDMALVDEPNSHMDKINELLIQINTLIAQYNQ
jgi:hypothetical protein